MVVMDNLLKPTQGRKDTRADRRARLRTLILLPAYSPDLNPTLRKQEAFSKIKGLLVRKAQARTREALLEAIGWALCAVTSGDARGFFEHCGYRMSVQSLW